MSFAAVSDAERALAVSRYAILDTPPEPAFDRITRLAARVFGAPIAALVFTGGAREWYKSVHGLDIKQVRAAGSVVAATPNDRAAALRAQVPLLAPGGRALGSLAIYDFERRPPPDADGVRTLEDLAAAAMEILESRAAAFPGGRLATNTVKAVIDAAPLAIISVDSNGIVRSWNPAAEQMFGWTESEVAGRPYPLASPEQQAEHEMLREAILGGATFANRSLTRRRKDGSPVQVSFSAAPLHGPDGEIAGALAILADVSEQLRAEEALRQSEEHLRLTFESSPLGIVTSWPNGIFRSVNASFCRLLDLEQREILGRHFREFIHAEDRSILEADFGKLVRGETVESQTAARLVKRGGEPVQVVVRHGAVRSSEGVPLFISGIFEDVTEQKRAEEALRQSEERYRALVELSPDAIIVHRDNRILYANTAAAKLYGAADSSELVGLAPLDFVAPEFHGVVKERIERLRKHGTPAPVLDEKHVRLDGTAIEVEVVSIAFVHEGEPAVQAVVRDIGERKRAEQAMRDSEMQFRAVFDGAVDAMCILDENWCYVDANPAAERLFGRPRQEILSRPFGSLSGPRSGEAVREVMRKAIEEGGSQRGTLRWVRDDGTTMDTEHTLRPNFLPGRHLLVTRDITEQGRLEQRFRQAQKMEAIGRLAGGVAHDFNNLLTIISGFSQMSIDEMKEGDPVLANLQEIDRAAERAADLTRQLLAFSRNQVLQPRILDLNAVIADTEKMLRRLIGEDIELITALGDGLGAVRVDAGQFAQVILNLAVNARDAMPNGGKLLIETANAVFEQRPAPMPLPAGRYVTLAVSDTGMGMDPETLSHIFEPFFTTKEKGKGTGLGLSTVYGIVKQSGGDVRASSEPGRGTTFRIYLPCVEGCAETQRAGREAGTPQRGTETILIVEDEGPVRALMADILRGRGYKVLEAANGGEALVRCEQFPGRIDLMISDIVMPGLNGHELAKRLEPLRPDMRVLHVSGYTDQTIVMGGDTGSRFEFVQKPFTPSVLADKVREVLDGKPS